MERKRRFFANCSLFVFLPFLIVRCASPQTAARSLSYRIVHIYPHNASVFTEGLEYRSGVLFESSGLYRQSSLLKEDLATGKAIQRIDLPDWAFGEGITVMARRIIQVTWQSETGFVYDTITMKVTSTFKYSGEGWGLTNDGETIYLSDGTPSIRCLDPETFKVKRIITVRDGSEPVKLVNELEWVKGRIYANVWHSNRMAIIDSDSGAVTAWVDLSGLVPRDLDNPEAVLNGIAYDAVGDRLFVTGKLWPQLFEIRLEQAR